MATTPAIRTRRVSVTSSGRCGVRITAAVVPADLESLVDWVDERFTPERAERVAPHLAHDHRDRGTVGWLESFVALGAACRLEPPPPIVRRRLRAHFAHWRDTAVTGQDVAERVDAFGVRR